VAGLIAAVEATRYCIQVAVFDTAFHMTMPPAAYRYAVPKALYSEHGIRRYGFHGSSYMYVRGAAATYLGLAESQVRAPA